MSKKLTDKQQRFVDEYLIDLNATQAAIRAGYSEKTASKIGSENLLKPEIQKYISERIQIRTERTEVTQDYVLKTIVDTIERCRQHKPVMNKDGTRVMVETEDGEYVPAYQFDSSAVLKGTDQLGRHLKMFTDKVEHSGNVGNESLTDDELDEKIRRLAQS
jgi:phage terminase small subunit